MPAIIRQLIDYKVWKSRGPKFKSFGEYALNQTSEGLGIENNQLLWLLRCSLDIDGIHVNEWASVLEEVEKSVKVQARADGRKIRSFNGNSLETLGKACADQHTAKITYLPSRNRNLDGQLIRLKKASPESYRKVLCGELSVCEGLSKPKRSNSAKTAKLKTTAQKENKGLSAKLDSLAWTEASANERASFISAIGWRSLAEVIPTNWDTPIEKWLDGRRSVEKWLDGSRRPKTTATEQTEAEYPAAEIPSAAPAISASVIIGAEETPHVAIEDGLDIPTFLKRGHPDCFVNKRDGR